MEKFRSGDVPLVSNRVNEKRELQNLNQRFAAYVQAVRSAQEKENQHASTHHETNIWNSQSNERLKLYEQQIPELQQRLEELMREKQNLDLDKVKYETFSSECENRIISLNETVFEQQTDLQRIHGALAAKEVELQEARAEATQPKLALDGTRLELEDYKQRLEEAERRLRLEENLKGELQKLLADAERKMQQEVMLYQQELTEMRNKLEKSHHTILLLENKVRNVGQSDSNLVDMMRKVREASEAELRRFMEETDAKYNLNLQEVKMRMEADVHNLTALAEENGHLRAQLDSQTRDIRALEAKLIAAENDKNGIANNLENEKVMFGSHIRNLEKKLQETQDLLLIKIQELSTSQEANIPLRLEINALKAIMEQEEKRLNLHAMSPENCFFHASSEYKPTKTSNQQLTHSSAFIENLSNGAHEQPAFVPSTPYPTGQSQKHTFTSSKTYHNGSNSHLSSYPLPNRIMPKRPASVPITTHGFRRVGGYQQESSNWPANDSSNKDVLRRSTSDVDQFRSSSPPSESLCSQTLDIKEDKNDKDESEEDLPPRPENPTPTKLPHRPSSVNHARYIPASHGQGKDYFDAMFNDLRKDTLYTKVTEKDTGHGVARVTSIDQDYINATGSYNDTSIVPESRAWYTGGATSSTGNVNIIQVAEDGSFVRIGNTSATQEESIGGFMLQQNVGGHPVAVFRFPPRARIKAATSTTVWSARAVNGIHDPPCHYIWKQLDKWGTGPECTTILCRPNGQAIAWITSAPRKVTVSKGYNYAPNVEEQTKETQRMMEDMRVKKQQDEINEENDENIGAGGNADLQDPTSLPSLYTTKPTLYRDEPYSPRPNPILKRPKSSPSPITTKACGTSGMLPSRTGTSTMIQRLPMSTPQVSEIENTQKYSQIDQNEIYVPPWSLYHQCNQPAAVKSAPVFRNTSSGSLPNSYVRNLLNSAPAASETRKSPGRGIRFLLPGSYLAPADQHQRGLNWIRSQHNLDFLPPMPKAFPCVTPIYRN